ncbi:MAG TPA: hypothetical protein VLL08_21670 [Kineosporiaceae bacterium]|nr:hypothetical protein [Kineosporiaceae bacterium]
MLHKMVMASLIATMSLVGIAPAEASSDRVTHGDAQAVFQAFGNGGWAILNHHDVDFGDFAEGLGAPADGEVKAAIRPFSGTLWDGRHFCAEDWHVILIAWIEGGDASFDMQDAKAIMNPVTIEFVLDGASLPTERTAIKRFLAPERFDMAEAYYFQQGAVLSPSALAVGSHTLAETDTSIYGTFTDQITFYIDAPGTGACL